MDEEECRRTFLTVCSSAEPFILLIAYSTNNHIASTCKFEEAVYSPLTSCSSSDGVFWVDEQRLAFTHAAATRARI